MWVILLRLLPLSPYCCSLPHCCCYHHGSDAAALRLSEMLGMPLPELRDDERIVRIEAAPAAVETKTVEVGCSLGRIFADCFSACVVVVSSRFPSLSHTLSRLLAHTLVCRLHHRFSTRKNPALFTKTSLIYGRCYQKRYFTTPRTVSVRRKRRRPRRQQRQ
jgi:hypothetical protein